MNDFFHPTDHITSYPMHLYKPFLYFETNPKQSKTTKQASNRFGCMEWLTNGHIVTRSISIIVDHNSQTTTLHLCRNETCCVLRDFGCQLLVPVTGIQMKND
jgi:hypothetical protein